jgi:PAS domain-containing protein
LSRGAEIILSRGAARLWWFLLSEIISQGVKERVFSTPDPLEAAEVILAVSSAVGDRTFRALFEQRPDATAGRRLVGQMEFLLDAFERILGAPPGSLERVTRARR